MAPKSKKAAANDDFILTLSDDENPIEQELELESELKSSGKKRRRDDDENAEDGRKVKSKKQKKKQQKNIKAQRAAEEEDEEEEPEHDGEEDGALDPEFEFDIGGVGHNDVTEGFDAWGENDRVGARGNKKSVDIDDILARRKQSQLEKEERQKRKAEKNKAESEGSDAEESEVADGDGDEEMALDLDDDELLAPDAFGMGNVESESDDDAGKNEDEDDEEQSDSQPEDGEGDGDNDDDDNDSVASPVPHPDDVRSDDDSDNDSEEDPEEIEKRNAFFAPEDQVADSQPSADPNSSFQSFNLSRPILRGLAAVGFSTPTPIQRKTIPFGLMGKDVVGGAVTGSGKTAAFVLPILERLLYRPKKVPTSRVVILMPTRELAIQCYNVATKLATYTDITFCQLIGGFSVREQENVLKRRPDIIIATPGRFIDHMRNSASFTVDTLEILVLDEADRMLEDGFADELNEILTTIPKSRQTMLFSATMTGSVDKLIRVGLNKPVRLMVDAKKQTVGTLIQEFVRLRPGREDKRLGYLLLLCKTVYKERVIIFFRQKKEAHRARIIFGLMDLKAAELHGNMSQDQRIKSVEAFRDGKAAFLLATDVASRGLDIKGVETVINYEAPQSHEIYLHRVGRTARAGRSGRACTIAAEPDRKVVKAAVKAGRSQGAKIVSRVIEPAVGDEWAAKVDGMQSEVDEIIKEEKQEKQLAQAEMEVARGENLIKHEDEIKSRPKRTWFETEREKKDAKKRGLVELNGPNAGNKEKKKLSGKDKKKLDDSRLREEGKVWKKGKTEREAKPTKGKPKSKSKPRPKTKARK